MLHEARWRRLPVPGARQAAAAIPGRGGAVRFAASDGTLGDGAHFKANEISAKCPSKYEQKADSAAVTLCTKGDKNVEPAKSAEAPQVN